MPKRAGGVARARHPQPPSLAPTSPPAEASHTRIALHRVRPSVRPAQWASVWHSTQAPARVVVAPSQ